MPPRGVAIGQRVPLLQQVTGRHVLVDARSGKKKKTLENLFTARLNHFSPSMTVHLVPSHEQIPPTLYSITLIGL